MILKLRDLEMVQAIHEVGTLTGASRRLYTSQPALSRQLAQLEDRLGAELFRRHPKGMILTREGHRILESAERVLSEIAHAEHDVKLLAQGYMGTVRVTTECYMCYHWLPWVTRSFAERFPKVEVQLVPEATDDPYGALERSMVDVAIVYSAPPDPGTIERTALFDDEIVAVVARGHALAEEPHVSPEILADETLLCHYAEPGRGVLEREFLEPAAVQPKRTMEMLVTPAVVEMARAGQGVAVMPRWILSAQGSLEGLTVLPLGEGGLWRTWYGACSSPRSEEPVLASLLEVMADELAKRTTAKDGSRASRIRLA